MKAEASNWWVLFIVTMISLLTPPHDDDHQQHHVSAQATQFGNETDRNALLEFKNRITDDPNGVLNSWNDSQHHCLWQGVKCSARHGRVISLALGRNKLHGTITPHIGNLSFVKFMNVADNRFYGEIPQQIGRLFRLRLLNMSLNSWSGEIPANLSHCRELRSLIITTDPRGLTGEIPAQLGSLSKLVILFLGKNNLIGKVPPSLGNLSSLQVFNVGENQLEGDLPNELGFLVKLSRFSVHGNKLTGEIPVSIFNFSSLVVFSVGNNFFRGNPLNYIGLNLPHLGVLTTFSNEFSGNIPISFLNASSLEMIDLSYNNFGGRVPYNLGNLWNLTWINLAGNQFGRNSSDDLLFLSSLTNCSGLQILGFDTNNFGGELPKTLSNFSSDFQQLVGGFNNIYGNIPLGLGTYEFLYNIDMEGSLLSGSIPSDFGQFQNLQTLNLQENKFSGTIPYSLFNLSFLYDLRLGGNNFEGSIPPILGNCKSMRKLNISGNKLTGNLSPEIFRGSFSPQVLDLSHNFLGGSVPLEIGKLTDVYVFNVSYNRFTGEIPRTIGGCSSMENLELQGNLFSGTIPSSLGLLKGILHLDLSQNNLTGEIPKELEKLIVLKYLNLSFNELQGEVPLDGVFGNSSIAMLAGNQELCGGISELHFQSCPALHRKKNRKHVVTIVVTLSISFSAILLSVGIFLYSKKFYRTKMSSAKDLEEDKFLRISYHELHRATTGFSSDNLIGSGNFGSVYKGMLDQHEDRLVAVKVLDLKKMGASKSFKAEVQAFRNIRHRNLVPVLTCCSSVDPKGQEFMALVYEFMENGSLDSWLHPETERNGSRNINVVQRVNIAIDVASALHYLHNDCGGVNIVHCDLKPSNILLDANLVAHVGDFGLAKLLPKTANEFTEPGTNSSLAIKGTIGYAAPEYGMGSKASIEGDAYGYGILLLEMFTGIRPTNERFVEGLDLHKYVQLNLSQEQVMKIVDPFLFRMEREGNGIMEGGIAKNEHKIVASVFEIGLNCSKVTPSERMEMDEVLRQLQLIKYKISTVFS